MMPIKRYSARGSAPLDSALAFIEAHFAEPVRLEQLAALSALSVSRFVTVFRQQFGLSPYRYLCDVRIRHAQRLLLSGMPGSVVAAEVGFFDQSHFGRHFKRLCGMTPSSYVRQQKSDAIPITTALQGLHRYRDIDLMRTPAQNSAA